MPPSPRVTVYHDRDYVAAAHAFDTTRKAAWIAESLRVDPVHGVELVRPDPLTIDDLVEVHDPRYVEAVRTGHPRTLAESQGFDWDPKLWTAVTASNGGAVAAALDALETGIAGSLSSGLHHARHDRGGGFCTFNGLVLAARSALEAGARRVLILDLDAHGGGGTHSLVRDDPRILHVDIVVSEVDCYLPSGRNRIEIVRNARDYLPAVEAGLDEVLIDAELDLVVYNAGMDPFEGDGIGGLRGITRELLADREALVFERVRRRGIPIAFVLAGGYVSGPGGRETVVELHRHTIEAAVTVA